MLGLMSVGMNLVYGTTGLQSFSHGEQVTLGGLMAYVGTQMLHQGRLHLFQSHHNHLGNLPCAIRVEVRVVC